ncbi:bacteriophage holin [Candidatus Woesearchaeota archaeon]|nr:bacteriophage holin [Candidatus Woesearchaeota archaeon]
MAKQKLDVLGLGLAIGIACAVYMFLIGLSAWLFGWGTGIVELISSLYLGFSATFAGSLIGAVWAFIDGFIAGVIIAWLYNKFRK